MALRTAVETAIYVSVKFTRLFNGFGTIIKDIYIL